MNHRGQGEPFVQYADDDGRGSAQENADERTGGPKGEAGGEGEGRKDSHPAKERGGPRVDLHPDRKVERARGERHPLRHGRESK
jgi:hypothetical protein